ncbi:hypothetical protein QQ045_003129 [Rhodiola kirilowii]
MSSGNRRRSTSQRDVPSSSRATANPNMDDYLHPGPIDPSLLTMQSVHRTEAIWRNQMDKEFRYDKPLKVMGHNVVSMNPRLTNYIANASFLPWTQVCNVKNDPRLCTALVERWRPETHTFHLNGGEATITLQDVSLLTGLPIDGEPVSGFGEFDWEPVCLNLLGVVPDRPKLKSMGSKTWFDDYLNNMLADADEETLKKYARAYILCLLGLTLMEDLSGDQVALHYLPLLADLDNIRRYSWGSTVLAFQYSQLCRAIKHCHPVLSIDGTQLYGKYHAKLLVACSLDANNGVLPVAFALAESENTSSWSWFMSCIREGVTSRRGLCGISNRHRGIMATMNEPQWSPPNAYHRICIHHFQSNFNTKVKDSYLKKKLGKVAYAKKEYKFAAQYEELMKRLKDILDVRDWLRNVDAHLWSLAMDTDGMRWGSMTTNASESFKGVLKHGRDLPISAVVMFTFKQLNKYFNTHHYRYDNTDSAFAPKVHERLEVTTGIKHHLWRVCIPERTCSCGKWTTLHIPCSHAIAVCKFTNREYSDYVPHEYTLEAYNMTWSYHLSPLPHSDFWEPYDGHPHMPNSHFKRTNVGRNPTR